MLSCGIVGLPNAGKSTLFNALIAKGQALTGKHPFTTIEKNVGVVPIPDAVLWDLAKVVGAAKVTPAQITFVDIAGLVKGANLGEGLGNQFLAHIREVDLLLHVVRYFTDESVAHVHEAVDPENDAPIVETELMLSDLDSLGRQIERLKDREERKKSLENESLLALAQKIRAGLNQGRGAQEIDLSAEEKKLVGRFNLITTKPVIYIANVDESSLKDSSKVLGASPTLTLCAKLEEELSKLPWTEQQQFLKAYDLKKTAIETVVASCYQALGLVTFYTVVGGKEARSWSLPRGEAALRAAGLVHSDFERGFIAAAVCSSADLISLGSYQKIKEAGKLRTEGKQYLVQDGDVIEFRFSV